ncbi:MAG TPA: 50S ribosomal protein L2 [Elusimicrobia bacterium]|nr:MAG: 50S ribosomal protein L2 [Elusimicrobia bacterium GWA2_64_40]OGR68112.1 MAG: 50S ribosomal protein L2 [Elusimicrobia bacterium GWB2_63_16]HAN05911.1 50S ribosomal protein L2 [Elusimicrobiota bacterium]HAU89855.1 50S ribosomal protein L2 [Elusimicrobiota bacterium]
MPIKSYRPYTPSRRTLQIADFSEITKTEPEKNLTTGLRKHGGRNNTGMVMVRHHGGGHRRRFRIIDFKREKYGVPAKVAAIEYDPNRNARIALLHYADGDKRYIPAPLGLGVGASVMSGPKAEIRLGNALPMTNIPDGTFIHAIEMIPGKGAQFVRAAGTQAQLMAKEGDYALVKMPSGELRKVLKACMATIGQVGNIEHNTITLGKAGRQRHIGVKPTVRGAAMNACDHPLGGGRGHSKGNNVPRSPWNQPSKGFKTRTKSKIWSWMIVQDRRKAKSA